METLLNKILVVEDDPDILELLQYNLRKAGYDIIEAQTGEQALEKAVAIQCDVILLDIMLPGLNGLDVCRYLTRNILTSDTPIILVSAKGEESDILRGLELGATDYVTKPFSIKTLLERVQAAPHARCETVGHAGQLRVGSVMLDTHHKLLLLNTHSVRLTNQETALVSVFLSKPNRILTRPCIQGAMDRAGEAISVIELEQLISNLRYKLGDHRDIILTMRGVGYRFSTAIASGRFALDNQSSPE